MPLTLMTAQGDMSSGLLPSDTAFQYGSSGSAGAPTAVGGPRVLLNKQFFAQSAPKVPGGTGADNVLAVYSIPANTFDAAGRSVTIRAVGSIATGTHTKDVKIIFNATTAVVGSTVTGGTTIADTGSYATTGATGFMLEATVTKDGAAGTNTQTGVNVANLIGATSPALLAPVAITATENAAILVAVTGNAGTTAADIGLNLLEIVGRC
jgi:hypothetical protein